MSKSKPPVKVENLASKSFLILKSAVNIFSIDPARVSSMRCQAELFSLFKFWINFQFAFVLRFRDCGRVVIVIIIIINVIVLLLVVVMVIGLSGVQFRE